MASDWLIANLGTVLHSTAIFLKLCEMLFAIVLLLMSQVSVRAK